MIKKILAILAIIATFSFGAIDFYKNYSEYKNGASEEEAKPTADDGDQSAQNQAETSEQVPE